LDASKVVCIQKQTQGKLTRYSCLVCRIGDEMIRRRQLNKSLENVAKFKYLEFTSINVTQFKYVATKFIDVAQFKHLETTFAIWRSSSIWKRHNKCGTLNIDVFWQARASNFFYGAEKPCLRVYV
jgi:hypothetical protein